jgi:hypothetical protein
MLFTHPKGKITKKIPLRRNKLISYKWLLKRDKTRPKQYAPSPQSPLLSE